MTNLLDGIIELTDVDKLIKVGDRKMTKCTYIGTYHGDIVQSNGKTSRVTLYNVSVIPELWCNLFSITAALHNGCKLSNHGTMIKLSKNSFEMKFDRSIKTESGHVYGVKIVPKSGEVAMAVMCQGAKFTLSQLHRRLGHPSTNIVKTTAIEKGWTITTNEEITCEHCAIAKARQKNVCKENTKRSNVPGERLYIDISSIQGKSLGVATYWVL